MLWMNKNEKILMANNFEYQSGYVIKGFGLTLRL